MSGWKSIPTTPWYRSLRVRIFFLIIWLGVGTILILTTYFLDHERKALERELEKRGVQIARTFSVQCIEPLLYEDRFGLYELAQTYLQDSASDTPSGPLIQYLVIADRGGEIFVDLQRKGVTPYFTRGELQITALAGKGVAIRNYDAHTLDISLPIQLQDHRIGTARLGVSRRSVDLTLADLRRKVVLYMAIIVLGGVLIGLWLAHRIISPVRALTRGAARLAAGHWGEEVQVPSRDEIGELAQAMNVMSRKIGESVEEIRRTQESLARAEKLNALGTLSSGLAHELKNPLTSIKMILQAMAKDPGDAETRKEDLEVMLGEVNQMDLVLTRFLEFARPSPLRRVWYTIDEIVEDALRLMNMAFVKEGVKVHREISGQLPPMKVDAPKVKQTLVNLFLNAIQAMPQGGDLWIRARQDGDATPGVTVEVEDSGEGVASELASRIFDPFVTTKAGGTGLGLSVVHSIVSEHGGRVDLISEKGRGALFRIFLPAGGNHADDSRSGR